MIVIYNFFRTLKHHKYNNCHKKTDSKVHFIVEFLTLAVPMARVRDMHRSTGVLGPRQLLGEDAYLSSTFYAWKVPAPVQDTFQAGVGRLHKTSFHFE